MNVRTAGASPRRFDWEGGTDSGESKPTTLNFWFLLGFRPLHFENPEKSKKWYIFIFFSEKIVISGGHAPRNSEPGDSYPPSPPPRWRRTCKIVHNRKVMLLAASNVTYIPSRVFSFSRQGKSRVMRTRKQSVSKTRAGDRAREKRQQQRQRRRDTKKPNPMNSDFITVIHQAQIVPENQTTNDCQTVTEIQPVKRKRLPKGKPRPYDIRSQPRPSRPRRNPQNQLQKYLLHLENVWWNIF